MSIPRGVIYHRVTDDLTWLLRSVFSSLTDKSAISEFEGAFASLIGRRHGLAFPFARTAIYFALKSRGFKPGTEIIMPPISIKGILDVVLDLKLKPVFVDLDPETLCFDTDQLDSKITENTGAILVTYLYGVVPKITDIIKTSRRRSLFVIEDFSQCLNGSMNGNRIGSFGDVGVYSASSIKTLDTYGGGILVCDDDDIATALRNEQERLSPASRWRLIQKVCVDLIRNVATQKLVFSLFVFPLIRMMSAAAPDSMIRHTGGRSLKRITSLPDSWFESYTSVQARAGLYFMKTLEKYDSMRVKNAEHIKQSVESNSVSFPSGTPSGRDVYWQLLAYFSNPEDTVQTLMRRGVDTSLTSLTTIYNLESYGFDYAMPNAKRLHENGFFVPCYPQLSESDRDRIVAALNSVG